MMSARERVFLCAALVCLASGFGPAVGAEEFPLAEGEVVTHDRLKDLKPWLPPAFWSHRQLFFDESTKTEIGPVQRDYSPPPVYQNATQSNRGKSRIGPDGALMGYRGGRPFPIDEISCSDDPLAGVKLIWNFTYRWQGFGVSAHFRYSYLDRGELLPLSYEGTTSAWQLKYRPEMQFAANGGDVFKHERRFVVIGFEVDKPREAQGTRTLTYRYADSMGPRATAQPEETWIYNRDIRRIRKISETQRSSAVAGTDFAFDDLFSFSGLPSQYEWRCLGETRVLAPTNTRSLGFPYVDRAQEDGQFGTSGLSYANDRWELRQAFRIEMVPKDENHPYARKEIWLDRQTMEPLFSFAYDRSGALWKIIHHNHRWSEDALEGISPREWYPGWKGVPEPRNLRVVSESIANVQTGTGNRLDFWDSNGAMPKIGDLRRYVDVQRLRRGR